MPKTPAVSILLFLLLSLNTLPCAAVTLISRSSGLEIPIKEEGRTELEVGDVNRDGNLDVVSVGDHGNPGYNSDEHGILVWLGDGGGSWAFHRMGEFGYGGCALADLDRDGRLDLAWGIHHNSGSGLGSTLIGAALGDGTGLNWSNWSQGLATNGETWGMFATACADFDEDGLVDILSESFGGSNGLQLYRNHGDGTWNSAWALTGGTVQYTVEACDFNADGHADILCTRSNANALLGDGAFGFTSAMAGLPAGTIQCVDAGDMDADGRDEMVFGLGSSGLRCYRYDSGLGSWQDASAGLPVSGTYYMCQFGDLDGDGDLDIIGFRTATGSVYLGDGAGHWTADATWTMPSPGDPSALRVDGDIDHDGREDILVQATQSGFPVYHNQLRAYSPWAPPDTIGARLVTPRGGETMRIGSIRDIRWLAAVPASLGPAAVEVRLSLDGPDGPWELLASGLPDNGRLQWRVEAAHGSSSCRMQLAVTASGQTVTAISPFDFSILPREGSVVEEPPAGGGRPFLIYPNPAGREVFVQLRSVAGDGVARGTLCAVQLCDVLGRALQTWTGNPSALSASTAGVPLRLIDRQGRVLPRGIYFVRVEAGPAVGTLRLVKE